MKVKPQQIKKWLGFAREDLKAAEISIEESLQNVVCFHSQQAIEKSLKALYLYYFDTIPKTHDLETILNKLKDKFPEITEFEEKVRFLNKFYVPIPFSKQISQI